VNHQNQSLPKQAQPSSQQAPAAMQVLNAEEMRAVVGGPIIHNGGEINALSAAYSNG
jgi:hypothetical protein